MQNMLCGLGAALQARLDTKLILVSRLSPWCKIFQLKPGDLIVSAYAFIRSLHDKYTLARWFGHAWYCFSDAILHAFPLTYSDFIIQFGVNPIIVICTKTSNGFAGVLCIVSLSQNLCHREEILFVGTSFKMCKERIPLKSLQAVFLFTLSIVFVLVVCQPACVCTMT